MNLCKNVNFDPILETTLVVKVTNAQRVIAAVKSKPVWPRRFMYTFGPLQPATHYPQNPCYCPPALVNWLEHGLQPGIALLFIPCRWHKALRTKPLYSSESGGNNGLLLNRGSFLPSELIGQWSYKAQSGHLCGSNARYRGKNLQCCCTQTFFLFFFS